MSRQYTLHRAPVSPVKIDYAAELNPQQCAAVTAPPGPALVIAGAGSGKTRTLIYRVAYLIENGVPPSNILLVTFTNKAAREMLERVTALLPNDIGGLWSGTFHSIGNRLLRRHPEAAGFRQGFSIMDREDQKEMLNAVIVAAGINPKDKSFPKGEVLADIFSYSINTERPIAEVLDEKYPYFVDLPDQMIEIQKKYEARKKSANSLDFDDLLVKPLRMLEQNPEIADFYRRQFQFILVDEYQDTNKIQADFIDALSAHHGNIMVVGDDAQSIYSWRGANFQNILQFPKRYPSARVYKIETNYRSVPEILRVANSAIAANVNQFPKELQSSRDTTDLKPALVQLADSNQQALFVAQRIQELRDNGCDLNEIAVLYRAHYHSMELQMELTRHGIPFQITSGIRFFEQAHIKDVAAFLKFVVNPSDEVAFKRMARLLPGIGARSAEQLWNGFARGAQRPLCKFSEILLPLKVPAKARKGWEQLAHTIEEIAPGGKPNPPAEMLSSVIEAVYDEYMQENFANYDQRREDLNVLGNYARQYTDAHEFLDQLALLSSLETEAELGAKENETEMVNLSSVHQAKGLEWKVVFVVWMCDGMFPSSRSLDSDEAIEEERRLFYVAVTRARDELYLTWPLMRLNAGYGEMFQRPSRFLGEVPKELIEEWQVNAGY
jgi:DNA helicase-2/ATP-dependent DNA helicase PcrA